MFLAPFIAVLAVLLLPQPAKSQASTVADLVGCYDLDLGPWEPERPPTHGDSLGIAPPPRVQLDRVVQSESPGGQLLVVRPAPRSLPSIHNESGWRFSPPDSVHVFWSTGFYGLSMALGVYGDTLRGKAETFSDVIGEPPQRADVTAIPIACDAPPVYPITSMRPVPREVLLEGGARVALGEPLDASLVADSGQLSVTLAPKPVGLFMGATEVRIWTEGSDEQIAALRVAFPETTDFSQLIAQLAEVLGPPTREGTHSMQGEITSQSALWENRATRLSITRSRLTSGGWRIEAELRDPRLW